MMTFGIGNGKVSVKETKAPRRYLLPDILCPPQDGAGDAAGEDVQIGVRRCEDDVEAGDGDVACGAAGLGQMAGDE